MKTINTLLVAVTGSFFAASAYSATIDSVTLDFEGVGDLQAVEDFYNGGDGEDFGISFSENALAIVDLDAGGSGNFANEPTADTVLFFLTGAAATLNVDAGFEVGFSFFYAATNNSGSIQVYDGLNATGNLLADLFLPTLPEGPGDPNGGLGDFRGSFGNFQPIGVAFDGVARSIDFGGTVNQIGFDNITFGSIQPNDEGGVFPADDTINPIPLPAGGWLLLSGLASVAAVKRRKKRFV